MKRSTRVEPSIGVDGKIYSDGGAGYVSTLGDDSWQLVQETKLKLVSKIKGEKWNLGTFLGELPETQKYLSKTLKDVLGIYRRVKRGLFSPKEWSKLVSKGKRYLKRRGVTGVSRDLTGQLSKRWLEFRYAISPMVYDLDDMLSVLYDSHTRPLISRVASGGTISTFDSIKGTSTSQSQNMTSNRQERFVCYFQVNPDFDSFKKLGLLNLPAVLWELTPLSFVVDMFLPVGDFIGHMDAMAGVTVLSVTRSTRDNGVTSRPSLTVQSSKYNAKTGAWDPATYTIGGSSATIDDYSRAPDSLDVSFDFTTSPTGKQLVDLVALGRQLVFKP